MSWWQCIHIWQLTTRHPVLSPLSPSYTSQVMSHMHRKRKHREGWHQSQYAKLAYKFENCIENGSFVAQCWWEITQPAPRKWHQILTHPWLMDNYSFPSVFSCWPFMSSLRRMDGGGGYCLPHWQILLSPGKLQVLPFTCLMFPIVTDLW